MKRDSNAMRLQAKGLTLLLAVCCATGAWADGYTYYDSNGFQQVYHASDTQSRAYPQYFPRIDPDSSYQSRPVASASTFYQPNNQSNYQLKPLTPSRPISASASKSHKALSTKIGDGFSDLWKSPSLKSGVAGAGIGLGAAVLTEHNLLRGSLIGAAYGVGVGLMDESYFFKHHPLVRRTAKGAAIGLGAATVTGAAALAPAAAVGAGVGLGIHYLKTH